MTPSHKALREGTADAHARLDGLFESFDLSDRASYAAFLSAHAQALLPVEAALDAAGAARITDDWEQRKRGALVAADLAALDASIPAPPPYAHDLVDDAAIAGALYVVEGSRLGGRLLARRVAPGLPKRYLDPGQSAENWRVLLARIDGVLYDEGLTKRAIAAALDVFAAFEAAGRHWATKV